jgi:hypothetical protein
MQHHVQKYESELITVTRWKSATSQHVVDQRVETGCHLGKREYFRKKTKTLN